MSELIRIGELAARSGVEKSTIQHYIRQGLICTAHAPHRNMHYYSADLVPRIKLIRELQARRNLPLAKIREELADEQGFELLQTYLFTSTADTDARPITRDRLCEDSAMAPDVLDRLEQRGLISSRREGRDIVYDSIDVVIVHACASMRRAGIDEHSGFKLDELDIYLAAMRDLIGRELMLFARVLANHSTAEIVEMAQRGFEGTNTLMLNLRRKLFLKMLGDARRSLRGGRND